MQLIEINDKNINAAGVKCVVAGLEVKTTKTGKQYLTGTVMDPTGTMGFKIWDNVNPMMNLMASGNAVELKSAVSDDFGGTVSLKISSVSLLTPEEAAGLIQMAPVPKEKLEEKLNGYIQEYKLEAGIEKLKAAGIWDRFLYVPAAMSHHHAYRHGLLQHSIEVCETALKMANAQKEYHGLELNRTVLTVSGLFHDIGKVYEYEINPLGLFTGFSEDGILIGHHFLSTNLVNKVFAKCVDADTLKQIDHCILSHHGRPEWGAAVPPKTPEAYLIHLSDMASSQPVSVKDEPRPLY